MKKSFFVIPLSFIAHILIINITSYVLTPYTYLNVFSIVFYNLAWFIATYSLDFYPTARREGFNVNLKNFFKLIIVFGLAYFTSFTFMTPHPYSWQHLLMVYVVICILLMLFRLFFYWARNLVRSKEYVHTRAVVIGRDKNLKKIRHIFDIPKYGYRYMGYFDNSKSNSPTYLGNIESSYEYIFKNNVEEVYCMASRLSKDDLEYSNLIKRLFDIIFSLMVIIFVLSWLIPLVYILMKLDSKGPLFFKQKRHGVNKNTFWCYKFRSMTKSDDSDTKMATKNDMRVTKLGKILRKTSIDELPQFFNVLKGDMSIVGPRPHMEVHTKQYETSVEKYLVRHFLKPGITGLAQVKGYRGEIIHKSDIVNRVRYDIFYMEKWSILLDIQIIILTVTNVFSNEEKAY